MNIKDNESYSTEYQILDNNYNCLTKKLNGGGRGGDFRRSALRGREGIIVVNNRKRDM